MKILILANHEYTLYGFRRELIDEMLHRGYQVHLSFPEGQYAPYFRQIGCIVHNTALSQHGMNPIKDLGLIMRYCKLIREVDPDAVITYTIKPNIYGGVASAICKKKYFATITGLGAAFEQGAAMAKFALALYRVAMQKVQAVFFQNREHQLLFEKNRIALGRHVLVSGSGVNLQKHCFEPYPADDYIRFLFIGRVTRDKGIVELLEAFREIRKQREDVQLHIVGPIEEDVQVYIDQHKETDGVVYHGRQEDVHPYMKDAHAVVLPSYHEGMANVLLEASACGRPVITTQIPGCKETFDENITGLGVPARNAQALANAMLTFAEFSYSKKQAMGQAARKKMEQQFDRQAVVQRYVEEIQKACQQ